MTGHFANHIKHEAIDEANLQVEAACKSEGHLEKRPLAITQPDAATASIPDQHTVQGARPTMDNVIRHGRIEHGTKWGLAPLACGADGGCLSTHH